jgi:hypothetical protein
VKLPRPNDFRPRSRFGLLSGTYFGHIPKQSDIPPDDLNAVAQAGLREAINKYTNPSFSFRPDDRLQGGFAIWWVRLQVGKLAESRGYSYNAAANELTRTKE